MDDHKRTENQRDIEAVLPCLRIRWINCQCHELVLPSGYHIVTDPYVKNANPGCCPPHQTPFEAEDFEGCDLAIIQHTHFDHDLSAGDLYRRFGCEFLVHEAVAYEFGKCFDIPYSKIITYATEGTYELEEFTFHSFKGYHRMNQWISGIPSQTEDGSVRNFGFYGHEKLEPLGTMFNSGYVISTKENYRIAFVAGDHMKDAMRHLIPYAPNLMIRQTVIEKVEDTIELCKAVRPQLILPTHYEGELFRGIDMKSQMDEISRRLKEEGYHSQAFYPERYVWYRIFTGVAREP